MFRSEANCVCFCMVTALRWPISTLLHMRTIAGELLPANTCETSLYLNNCVTLVGLEWAIELGRGTNLQCW